MYVLIAMFVTFPTSHAERSPLKAPAPINTAPHSNREKSRDKNGLEKKKEESTLFKNRISADTERRRKKGKEKKPKKDQILERGGKSVRTLLHGCHFPDLPFGEISIEGSSTVKHCTTATTKKSRRIKMGWKKKEGRAFC